MPRTSVTDIGDTLSFPSDVRSYYVRHAPTNGPVTLSPVQPVAALSLIVGRTSNGPRVSTGIIYGNFDRLSGERTFACREQLISILTTEN